MKRCESCASLNPDTARYCMQCGRLLPAARDAGEIPEGGLKTGGLSVLALSLTGSVLLSLVLMFVFGLPIFFLAAFLPLFWLKRGK